MILIAGTRADLEAYLQTIEIFDVDWLAGMSVGVFPLERVEASTVVPEIEKIFGEGGPTPWLDCSASCRSNASMPCW